MEPGQQNKLLKDEYHDACGIGFIAELSGKPGRRAIELSIEALKRMSHRGATGADDRSSDGTGLLVDIPHEYFKIVLEDELGIKVKNEKVAVGMVFTTATELPILEKLFSSLAKILNIEYVGHRPVPINLAILGQTARETCPEIVQYFFTGVENQKYTFETRLYLLRKMIEREVLQNDLETFICSLSSKTIIFKGMMKPHHLARFYSDLNQPEFKVKFSLFHERFSTNTISTWSMAQPFRMLAHNGEINTIKGNRLWMQTRESSITSPFWAENIESLKPIVSHAGSDSYSLDNILEFLVQSGRTLFESVMMLIPEPYSFDNEMPGSLKDFYIYHENLIEPWDGPAALVFTDGDVVGAKLDRNGLRPLRYCTTKDGLVVMASEAGVVDIEENNILVQYHMHSGENLLVKLDGSGIVSSETIVGQVTMDSHYTKILDNTLIELERGNDIEEFGEFGIPNGGFDKRLRIAFGVDKEDMDRFLIPMSQSGKESVGSMGDDAPPAVISNQSRKLYDYFKQQFAQVTNPPIDSIRERYVMSLYRYIGTESNLLSDSAEFNGSVRINSPVLSPREVHSLKEKKEQFPHIVVYSNLPIAQTLQERLEEIKLECENAALSGVRLIFLSDEGLSEGHIPIPMLMVVSMIHQHLIRKRVRNNCALISLTGDAIEDHHIACLVGFGASAVYPFMAYELIREHFHNDNWEAKLSSYRTALEKGLLKIMGKMGISTLSSYHGSMLFNTIGLSKEFAREYFPSVKSVLGGLNTEMLQKQLIQKCERAFSGAESLDEVGRFKYKKNSELHGFAPTIFKRIRSISQGEKVQAEIPENGVVYIRDILGFKSDTPIDVSQVESGKDIIKRFGLGAVSFGAISEETHRMLARAGSVLGIRTNTGEGGEQKDRYSISNPDKSENCFTKQIASGRFGVTTHYLSAAREIQIKIGQGAKPGEGGQLPGEKVTLSIANDRHTTPGVPLISPPPHHDIYSIEDLAQLIYDMKQVNTRANICVKLVSQFGIGIIASGVVKAGANTILISGNDGGTGASPLGSLKNTGLPWEIGLAEVHRTLVKNGLRNRVTLRVDGGLKNGKDIVVAALLGAEEYDFGTSALVALGCVMARQCHLNTCPAGIATQDKDLRKKFKGKPEHLVNYISAVAGEVRESLAQLGFDSLDEIIGRNDKLKAEEKFLGFIKEHNIDLSALLESEDGVDNYYIDCRSKIQHFIAREQHHMDENIIEEVRPAIISHGRAIVNRELKNTDRSIGTRLSGLISFLYGPSDFKGHIQYRLNGSAGQSLGAFLIDNVEIRHSGIANDYVGKGMCGGTISIRFPKTIRGLMETNTIIGNVALYGATGGELYVSGHAGERFAVRNSGASAVVEGVGNHCCEYMTRGFVMVLGKIGKNFGAGMTGGVAFILGDKTEIEGALNKEYVALKQMNESDEDLVFKYLVNHRFHTKSKNATNLLADWDTLKNNFVKIVPIALELVDYNKIYEEQYSNRLMKVFND